MDQNSEQPNEEISILGKRFSFKGWHLEFGIMLVIILCAIVGRTQWLSFFFFLLFQHPALYLLLVVLLFIISIISILKSDENNNAKQFYISAFLFCLSIIGGILYFIFPAIFWFFTRD
jgi:hypothetical protein